MREIKGIIFDCDGTLADTMPLHWKAWNVVTAKHGLHFTEERFYALGGVPSRDIFRMLCKEQSRDLDCLALLRVHNMDLCGARDEIGHLPSIAQTLFHAQSRSL